MKKVVLPLVILSFVSCIELTTEITLNNNLPMAFSFEMTMPDFVEETPFTHHEDVADWGTAVSAITVENGRTGFRYHFSVNPAAVSNEQDYRQMYSALLQLPKTEIGHMGLFPYISNRIIIFNLNEVMTTAQEELGDFSATLRDRAAMAMLQLLEWRFIFTSADATAVERAYYINGLNEEVPLNLSRLNEQQVRFSLTLAQLFSDDISELRVVLAD
ncbi:MAG: hypothetical protein FWE37_08775 [Spirochaetaceae bacterium]|nr:hypothetical protein [Spirochaetaceae bacterium]